MFRPLVLQDHSPHPSIAINEGVDHLEIDVGFAAPLLWGDLLVQDGSVPCFEPDEH